ASASSSSSRKEGGALTSGFIRFLFILGSRVTRMTTLAFSTPKFRGQCQDAPAGNGIVVNPLNPTLQRGKMSSSYGFGTSDRIGSTPLGSTIPLPQPCSFLNSPVRRQLRRGKISLGCPVRA